MIAGRTPVRPEGGSPGNPPSIPWLIAVPGAFTCTEAARWDGVPVPDAWKPPDREANGEGLWVLDDTPLALWAGAGDVSWGWPASECPAPFGWMPSPGAGRPKTSPFQRCCGGRGFTPEDERMDRGFVLGGSGAPSLLSGRRGHRRVNPDGQGNQRGTRIRGRTMT